MKALGLFIPFFLGWALGANDTANIFGTAVGARLVRFSKAILLTALFVILGALLQGQKCFATIKALTVGGAVEALVATFSAAMVCATMTCLGLPVSSTQCVVGALTGLSILKGATNFPVLAKVMVAWLATPIVAGALAYAIHRSLAPLLLKFVSVSSFHSFMQFLVVIFGCYGAYSLGANNLANVVGPQVASGVLSPFLGQILGGLAIASGALTYSRKVMETVGAGIVPMDAFSSFVAVFSHALSLHFCTFLGIPTSASQAIVGAVIGVGLVYGVPLINRRLVAFIFGGWALAFLSSGLLASLLSPLLLSLKVPA